MKLNSILQRRIVTWSLWSLPIILWLDCCLRPISEPDLFFYFALIKTYLRDGVWPQTDPFLYTLPADRLMTLHQWLGYWIFYYPYVWLGWTGPILVMTVFVGLLLLIPLLPFWWKRRPIPSYYPLLYVLAIFTAHHRFRQRVSLFGDLFTVSLVAGLLFCAEELWFWCALPVMFLLWAQLHPSYPLGWAILAGFFFFRDWRTWRKPWLISAGLCVAAPFVNAMGLEGTLYPFRFALEVEPYLRQYVVEWLPLTDSRLYAFTFLYIPALTLIPWLLFKLVQKRKEAAYFEWLLFFLACALNLKSVRFGLIAQGMFLLLIAKQEFRTGFRRLPGWGLAVVGVATAVIFGLKFGTSSTRHQAFADRFDIDTTYFPQAATDDLTKLNPQMRVFNSFGFGGYLSFRWLGRPPIFFHGFSTNFKFFEDNYNKPQESETELDALIRRYDIGVFFLSKLGNDNNFIVLLNRNKNWQKIREDQASVIFAKREGRVFGQ